VTQLEPCLRSQRCSASGAIGVATSERASSADELIRRADAAMYRAKAQGKGRVAHFDVDDPAGLPRIGG